MISRRKLIQTLSVLGGSAVAATALPTSLSAAIAKPVVKGSVMSDNLTAVVLLPRRNSYLNPSSGGFRNGLELALSSASNRICNLRIEEVGRGINTAVRKTRRVLEQESADLVIGLLNPKVGALLAPLCESYKKPLVMATVGERLHPIPSSNVVTVSLGYSQTGYALGQNIGQSGVRAVIASSFRESGFDALAAFEQGFSKGGGKVISRWVAEEKSPLSDYSTFFSKIKEENPDYIYASFNGEDAAKFIHEYVNSGIRTPLVGSSFMFTPEILAYTPIIESSVKVGSTWQLSNEAPLNAEFKAEYLSTFGLDANAYAVLGYETGLLVASALANKNDISSLPAVLRAAQIAGPRGVLQFDEATQSFMSGISIANGQSGTQLKISPDSIASGVKSLVTESALAVRGGWINPYLA